MLYDLSDYLGGENMENEDSIIMDDECTESEADIGNQDSTIYERYLTVPKQCLHNCIIYGKFLYTNTSLKFL